MTSVGREGKSGDGKTRGIYKTFEIGGCVATEKKEESLKKVTLAKMK